MPNQVINHTIYCFERRARLEVCWGSCKSGCDGLVAELSLLILALLSMSSPLSDSPSEGVSEYDLTLLFALVCNQTKYFLNCSKSLAVTARLIVMIGPFHPLGSTGFG